jgi:hypothetical protein
MCDSSEYSGSVRTNVGTCDKDIQNRILMKQNATKMSYEILWNIIIYKRIMKTIRHSTFESILLYGSES